MLNLLKKYIFLNLLALIALIGIGFYFAQNSPGVQAADNNFTLTWSSDSYIPPGYAGLALPTQGSQIKVFVLPTKKLNFNPERLTYRWLLDDEIMGWAGGQGKSVFSFKATKWPSDRHTVESQVLDGESVIWRGFIEIKISKTEAVLQLSNNDYAVSENLNAKTGQTLKILATPFFFNTPDINALNFQWELDGQELANVDNKDFHIFSLTIPAGKLEKALIKNLNLLVTDKKNTDYQASSQTTLRVQ